MKRRIIVPTIVLASLLLLYVTLDSKNKRLKSDELIKPEPTTTRRDGPPRLEDTILSIRHTSRFSPGDINIAASRLSQNWAKEPGRVIQEFRKMYPWTRDTEGLGNILWELVRFSRNLQTKLTEDEFQSLAEMLVSTKGITIESITDLEKISELSNNTKKPPSEWIFSEFSIKSNKLSASDLSLIDFSNDSRPAMIKFGTAIAEHQPMRIFELLRNSAKSPKEVYLQSLAKGFSKSGNSGEALALLADNLDEEFSGDLATHLFEYWIPYDSYAAAEKINDLPPGEIKNEGMAEVVDFLIGINDKETAKKWFAAIDDQKTIDRLLKVHRELR